MALYLPRKIFWQGGLPARAVTVARGAGTLVKDGTAHPEAWSTEIERSCNRGSDMRVLFALRRGGPPYVKRPTDLFKALLVTSGAMTKKVDRLATLGMVERVQDPGHLGGFLIRLTKKGFRVADEMVETLAKRSAIDPAMGQFTPTEREQVGRFALRMLVALEAAGAFEGPGSSEES